MASPPPKVSSTNQFHFVFAKGGVVSRCWCAYWQFSWRRSFEASVSCQFVPFSSGSNCHNATSNYAHIHQYNVIPCHQWNEGCCALCPDQCCTICGAICTDWFFLWCYFFSFFLRHRTLTNNTYKMSRMNNKSATVEIVALVCFR